MPKTRRRTVLAPLLLALALAMGAGAVFSAARPAEAEVEYYLVRKHILTMAPDGTIEATETTVSAAFVVNQHRWAAASMPVGVSYNPGGAPAGHDLPAILQQAITTWNAVSPSSFSFTYAGTSTGATGSCDNVPNVDGKNTVRFVDLPANTATLGTTCTLWPASQGPTAKLVEFDMELNDDASLWSSMTPTPGNKYDLPTTILHELGHAAGLGHSTDGGAVMYPSLGKGVQHRNLSQDDISGLLAAYPSSVTPSPSPTATATPTRTPTAPPTAVVTPPPTQSPPVNTFFRVRAPQLSRD